MPTSAEPTPPEAAPAPSAAAVPTSLTDDGFLGGRLNMLQPEKGYRAGIDAVFLASTIPCRAGDTLFEAGVGAGVSALCVAARVSDVHVTGVEVASRYAMMAEQNAKRNGLADRLRVIHGDVKDALRRDLVDWPAHGSFAHAFANPPYLEADKAPPSPNSLRAVANTCEPEDLELWVRVLATMVTHRGTATIIHRAEALGRLLTAMEERFGDIRVAPLFAREGTAASRVIVQGVRGTKGPLQLLPGLVLHGAGSHFTPEAEAILRDAMAWRLLTAMEERFGDIRVAPLFAREGTAASRVIVQGVRGTKGPLQLLPGLVLHGAGSHFTPEAEAILRDAMAWRLR